MNKFLKKFANHSVSLPSEDNFKIFNIRFACNSDIFRGYNFRIFYEINTEHPLVKKFYDSLDDAAGGEFKELTNIFGEYIPVDSVHADAADEPNALSQRSVIPDGILDLTFRFVGRLKKEGIPQKKIENILENTEPFNLDYDWLKEQLADKGLF